MNHQNALIEHSRVHTGEKHSVVWIIWNIMSELNPVKNLIRVNTAEKDWRTCVILNVILKFTALEKHAKELVKNKKILSFVSTAQQVSKTINCWKKHFEELYYNKLICRRSSNIISCCFDNVKPQYLEIYSM